LNSQNILRGSTMCDLGTKKLVKCSGFNCEVQDKPENMNDEGLCFDCIDKIKCTRCKKIENPDNLNEKGLCDNCAELGTEPTGDCDHDGDKAVANIAGTNLCEDCLEQYYKI